MLPFALILTHKRGVGLGIFSKAEHLQTPQWICTDAKTAENLSALFAQALREHHLSTQNLNALAVGIGPGSFTGLRLGCAFAQGFAWGRQGQCKLWTITTTAPQSKDETIALTDLEDALERLRHGDFCEVDELVPCYGQEPGPVVLLREKERLQDEARAEKHAEKETHDDA
jgi:hypothetical protein